MLPNWTPAFAGGVLSGRLHASMCSKRKATTTNATQPNPVTPAKAGVSHPEVRRTRHDTLAFAGVTAEGSIQ